MRYSELPKQLSIHNVSCKEMIFYQYLPIKLVGMKGVIFEDRLKYFDSIIKEACSDFIKENGLCRYINSNIYLTAKYMYQPANYSFNRIGYHSDGFLTDDINYIWSDRNPTIFNSGKFNLTMDDAISMKEMDIQALRENEITFPNNTLLRLNQFNIHKVNDIQEIGMRTFIKVSFSKDRYDLVGNSHNYLIDYNWEMKDRKDERNIPQTIIING